MIDNPTDNVTNFPNYLMDSVAICGQGHAICYPTPEKAHEATNNNSCPKCNGNQGKQFTGSYTPSKKSRETARKVVERNIENEWREQRSQEQRSTTLLPGSRGRNP